MPNFKKSDGFKMKGPLFFKSALKKYGKSPIADYSIEKGSHEHPHGEPLAKKDSEIYKDTPLMKTKSWEQGYKDWKAKGNTGSMTEFKAKAEEWWASDSGQAHAKKEDIKHRMPEATKQETIKKGIGDSKEITTSTKADIKKKKYRRGKAGEEGKIKKKVVEIKDTGEKVKTKYRRSGEEKRKVETDAEGKKTRTRIKKEKEEKETPTTKKEKAYGKMAKK